MTWENHGVIQDQQLRNRAEFESRSVWFQNLSPIYYSTKTNKHRVCPQRVNNLVLKRVLYKVQGDICYIHWGSHTMDRQDHHVQLGHCWIYVVFKKSPNNFIYHI